MKTISVVVPCYNEAENVEAMADAIRELFKKDLQEYRYEIIFIDNDSSDSTREIIRRLCVEDEGIKAIFNAKNFGQFNSPYYAMLQSTGDCTILMAADFQDPVEMIPRYVLEWEYGYKIVIGIKSSSRENKLMYWLRGCYYKLIKKLSDVEQIEQFTGFGLYDAEFIQILRDLDDPTPFLRGIVAELGFRRKEIPYEQPRRRAGKTSNNFYRLYDAAMLSITSYTKAGLRLATIFGSICSAASILVALVYLVMKLMYWDRFAAGMAPLLIGMCFLGSVQIFFIGMVGEYILSINQRVMKRPLVVEEERINFDNAHSGGKKGRNGKKDIRKSVASQLGPSALAKKEKSRGEKFKADKGEKLEGQQGKGEKPEGREGKGEKPEGREGKGERPEGQAGKEGKPESRGNKPEKPGSGKDMPGNSDQGLSWEASDGSQEAAAASEGKPKRRRRRRKPKGTGAVQLPEEGRPGPSAETDGQNE